MCVSYSLTIRLRQIGEFNYRQTLWKAAILRVVNSSRARRKQQGSGGGGGGGGGGLGGGVSNHQGRGTVPCRDLLYIKNIKGICLLKDWPLINLNSRQIRFIKGLTAPYHSEEGKKRSTALFKQVIHSRKVKRANKEACYILSGFLLFHIKYQVTFKKPQMGFCISLIESQFHCRNVLNGAL